MTYLSKEKLTEELNKTPMIAQHIDCMDLFDAINNSITENVTDIVHCKDCKHGQYEEWDNGECVDKTVYCDGYGIHKPDWFCADGERVKKHGQ